MTLLLASTALIAILACLVLLLKRRKNGSATSRSQPSAYIFTNTVTHRRFIPTTSYYCFTYPTMSLFLPLDALENNELDLCDGWLFGYNSFWSISGIRPGHYLTLLFATKQPGDEEASQWPIQRKLMRVLSERGWDTTLISEIWLATMPRFLGAEMNPLSVYYCYKADGSLWLVGLEVHNTLNEKHIYVLETGVNEEKALSPSAAFDHTWIFPRQFHVSPFSDRTGYYRCCIHSVPSPSRCSDPPRPTLKLDILASPDSAERTIGAIIATKTSTPFTTTNFLRELWKMPFPILLTLPRTLYQAWRVHHRGKMAMYPRPEPVALKGTVETQLDSDLNPVEGKPLPVSGAIGWQEETFTERWAREWTIAFLQRRVMELNGTVTVDIVSSNPRIPSHSIASESLSEKSERLTIAVRSPRFFTTLLMTPTALHALLLGCDAERIFKPSSRDLFLSVFSFAPSRPSSWLHRAALEQIARIRRRLIPQRVLDVYPTPLDSSTHFLDDVPWPTLLYTVASMVVYERLEKKFWSMLGARFVPRMEPWNGWDRLRLPGDED